MLLGGMLGSMFGGSMGGMGGGMLSSILGLVVNILFLGAIFMAGRFLWNKYRNSKKSY